MSDETTTENQGQPAPPPEAAVAPETPAEETPPTEPTGPTDDAAVESEDATIDEEPQPEGHKLKLSIANFPTAPEPSIPDTEKAVTLVQSDVARMSVGQHKRIHTPIGLRSKRGGPKEPTPGHHIES